MSTTAEKIEALRATLAAREPIHRVDLAAERAIIDYQSTCQPGMEDDPWAIVLALRDAGVLRDSLDTDNTN